MQDVTTYTINVLGALNEDSFNATSPQHVEVNEESSDAAELTVQADQSGLIGLLRHLHHQGYVLLSVKRER